MEEAQSESDVVPSPQGSSFGWKISVAFMAVATVALATLALAGHAGLGAGMKASWDPQSSWSASRRR